MIHYENPFKGVDERQFRNNLDKSAATKWNKSTKSYENYQKYINGKRNKFELTYIDLLYISNFKGGNGTIHELDEIVDKKLIIYSKKLKDIETKFNGKFLYSLNESETKDLIEIAMQMIDISNNMYYKIDGFGSSYISALLNSYFPNLLPILDRRLLCNLNVITKDDLDSQRQVKNIECFYGKLILEFQSQINENITIRYVDNTYFIKKLPYWAQKKGFNNN